jgi:drug/metabolite transporter (DMT)-like permease
MLAAPLALSHFGSLVPHDYVLLAIAALAAGFGQLAMTEGFRFLSVTAGSAFQMTLPLIISLGGVVFFAEHFTALQIVGGVLILAGSYQVVVKSGK